MQTVLRATSLSRGSDSARPPRSQPQPTSRRVMAPARPAWSCLGPLPLALHTTPSTDPLAPCSPGLRSLARPPQRATRTQPSSWTPFTRTGSRLRPHRQRLRNPHRTLGLLSRAVRTQSRSPGAPHGLSHPASQASPDASCTARVVMVETESTNSGFLPGRMLRAVAVAVVNTASEPSPSRLVRRFQSPLTRQVPQSCAGRPLSSVATPVQMAVAEALVALEVPVEA